jgi:hypothetical protein
MLLYDELFPAGNALESERNEGALIWLELKRGEMVVYECERADKYVDHMRRVVHNGVLGVRRVTHYLESRWVEGFLASMVEVVVADHLVDDLPSAFLQSEKLPRLQDRRGK